MAEFNISDGANTRFESLDDQARMNISTEEPLPQCSPTFDASVREELIKENLFQDLLDYRNRLKNEWNYEFYLKLKSPSQDLERSQLRKLCNQLTALYWLPFPKIIDNKYPLPTLPFGCMLTEWFRYHDGEPNIEYGNFFANVIRVFPGGPESIPEVANTHHRLCGQAEAFLDSISCGETSGSTVLGPGKEPEKYKLKPTYPAVVLVLDRWVDPDMEELDARVMIRLANYAKRQSVLLVRLRKPGYVDDPVDFEKLKEERLCLPLDRADVEVDAINVFRVSLATAVKFVSDLEMRVEGEHSKRHSLAVARKRSEAWADAQLQKADGKGLKNASHARGIQDAIQRVRAMMKGTVTEPLEPNPLCNAWME